ncbi:hypothetical protein QYM36_007545 [Artemia franciscana]|uniref:Uncharacterized protein n=1 Tax=Artemia franciscana TaxID=6661 RepID=A0AA88IH45_ARTSF|nr:hypothetical protein QYM36_007545 [Artemia franciscana]
MIKIFDVAAEAAGCLNGGQMKDVSKKVSTEAAAAFQGVQPSASNYQNGRPDYAPPPYKYDVKNSDISEAPPNPKQDGTPYGFG